MFQSIILAGGFGTRLKSISGDIPKPMMEVGGEPFLYRLMRELELQGCKTIVLSLHYLADYVIERIELDRPVTCEVKFCIEDRPLGTGGAIKKASALVSSDLFVVLNGDTLCNVDYAACLLSAVEADLVVTAIHVDDVSRYGRLIVDNGGNILDVNEKGYSGPGLINAGTYVVRAADIRSYPEKTFSFENDFLPTFKGNLRAHHICGDFVDIGVPADYKAAFAKFS